MLIFSTRRFYILYKTECAFIFQFSNRDYNSDATCIIASACCDLFLFGVQQCFHARLCLEQVHRAAPVQATHDKHTNTGNSLLLAFLPQLFCAQPAHGLCHKTRRPSSLRRKAPLQKPFLSVCLISASPFRSGLHADVRLPNCTLCQFLVHHHLPAAVYLCSSFT